MTEHVGVQRAASCPFDQRPVSQLLSAGNPLGERAFADRADCALRAIDATLSRYAHGRRPWKRWLTLC